MISKEMTIKLQKIIKDDYGINLSFAKTSKLGNDLVDLFDVLAKMNFDVGRKIKACKKTSTN